MPTRKDEEYREDVVLSLQTHKRCAVASSVGVHEIAFGTSLVALAGLFHGIVSHRRDRVACPWAVSIVEAIRDWDYLVVIP